MIRFILLFILLPTVIQACLVVRSPKCECLSLALDSSNIQATVGSHSFFKNVSSFPISAPRLTVDDCSVSMSCEGAGQNLVVFDTTAAVMFGAYSAEGFCDASTQNWLVDDGSGLKSYHQLYGACVTYGPPKCECISKALSSDNIETEIGNHPFYKNVSGYSNSSPKIEINDCAITMYCELAGLDLIVFDTNTATSFGAYAVDGFCDASTQTWQVDDGSGLKSYNRLYGLCVDFKLQAGPSDEWSNCTCGVKVIDGSNAEALLKDYDRYQTDLKHYALAKPVLGGGDRPGCPYAFGCDNGWQRVVVSDRFIIYPLILEYFCRDDGFAIQYHETMDQKFEKTPFLYFTCADFSQRTKPPTTTRLPTTTTPPLFNCPCQVDIVGPTNAEEYLGRYDYYLYNVSRYTPGYFPLRSTGCPFDFTCLAGESKIFSTSEYSAEVRNMELFCDAETESRPFWGYNDIANGRTGKSPYLIFSCVDFAAPLPDQLPISSMCNCPHGVLLGATNTPTVGKTEANYKIKTIVSDDRCQWNVTCREYGVHVFADGANGERFESTGSSAVCDMSTKKWTVTNWNDRNDPDRPTGTFNGVNEYHFQCINIW